MRILVDRHHADLLYSLQRLFEDRLGVEVWVPFGREWWDAEYWQFGKCFGDDRLVRQYLDVDESYRDLTNGHVATFDPAHPDRLIRCCSLAVFRELDEWAFIMPTVQENQEGFKRLADEVGARYLYHVGNTGQQVNWELDPFVLSTSELPIPAGKGLTVHQEIDSEPGGAFQFSQSENLTVVRNAVNAFNRLPGYAAFLEGERLLPSWTFTTHGHEGRDGDINPVTALGELMRTAGWAWHDKPVGDGFGHVIHAWAAVGRPLIGHGGYYAGKLAEPLWQHQRTAIDLNKCSLHEALAFMLEVAEDPERHAAMCTAVRATFDQLVDYESEAQAVLEALF